jgi:DNA polymerase III epsilon subunit-like protein
VLAGRRLVVVDVEGNGQQPPEIVEIAALPVDSDPTSAGMRSWLVRPRRKISPLVTRKVHGISNADVANCPAWSNVAGEVAHTMADRILLAHNASVEYRVLSAWLPGWAPPLVLDTLRLAKHVWPGLPGYSLDALIVHAEIDTSGIPGQRHRAAFDAWCTWRLLCALVEHSDLDWLGLVNAAALPGFVPHAEPEGGLW